ncbi:hypothetical protein [Rhodovulum steppense]|uniref:hypothetical protein n=1 Tax=Rhodovulum steppense TaxID=540251 RepID=UPI00104637FE|nr:hypothetical protein [Rhodovulum steppense]
MKDTHDFWIDSERLPEDLFSTVHSEKVALALHADGVLPAPRETFYGLHLRFVRFLISLPEESVRFTRRLDLLGPAYLYINKAIKQGYLTTSKDQETGKILVAPSKKLKDLIQRTEPTDAEVISA